ncbi:hypothetical protein LCGC14_0142830 [marine sediment metagenome]|uniref:B box-type domain-containing protein n=1 Tax=marine sediment metagenome TaxID=412755 RepID=A0A0F9Y2W5_9ZZZZ
MNDKLVRRAALAYKNWMVEQAATPPSDRISHYLQGMEQKIQEMAKWEKIYRLSGIPRTQESTHVIDNESGEWTEEYIGIVTPGVYQNIVDSMLPELGRDVETMLARVAANVKIWATDQSMVPLTMKEAIEEITAINTQWSEVIFRNGWLNVKINDVCLEDGNEEVELGGFWLQLDIQCPQDGLTIESIDNVQSSNKGLTHPHVLNEKLCEGQEGEETLTNALNHGSLEYYFSTVEAIMRTYNDEFPHEKLRYWYKENQLSCDSCNESISEEQSIYCEECYTGLCDHCAEMVYCEDCGNWRCDECSTSCDECNEGLCISCANTCNLCTNIHCGSCIRTCEICDEDREHCIECSNNCADCSSTICDDCVDGAPKCSVCEDYLCPNCEDTCGDCSKTTCSNCINRCLYCGVSSCEKCDDKHYCILAGTGV